jgi:hypothetical protein
VTGANLTGNSTTDCYFRSIPTNISVNCSSSAGPPAPSGPIGGFKVEVINAVYAGQDMSWTGDYNCQQINLSAEADVLINLLSGTVWYLGNTQSGDCEDNPLIEIPYDASNPLVIDSVSRTYHTVKFKQGLQRSSITGLTDALVVNHSLLSTCNNGIDYLSQIPPLDIRWHGSSLGCYIYGFLEIEYPTSPPWGVEETVTDLPIGGFNFYHSKTLQYCKVDHGMTEEWTERFTFRSRYGGYFGGTLYPSAECHGMIDVTFRITYLG